MNFLFCFLLRFDILVDGYNNLDRNSVRYYLLFRARDTVYLLADPSDPATRALLLIGLLTVLPQLEPGGPVLGRVRDFGIGVVPGFLRPGPCAYRSDSGP